MKRCSKCLTIKPADEFGKNRYHGDGLNYYCKLCRQEYDRRRYAADPNSVRRRHYGYRAQRRVLQREQLWSYLKTHPCTDCGLTDPEVMEFDHVRGKKRYDIGFLIAQGSFSWETILAELEKCEVVCANCHRRRTNQRGGWWRSTYESSRAKKTGSADPGQASACD